MSAAELILLQNSIGQLISINSFLSTTKSRHLALFFLSDPELAGEKPFADITSRSCFFNEEEVLIMFGSIFQIVNIVREINEIPIVKIELCTNDNKAFSTILEHLKNEYAGDDGETDFIYVGQDIRQMGCSSTAEKYFHRYLSSLGNEDIYLSTYYYNLAVVANNKGDYHLSLDLHLKSLQIRIRTLEPNHLNLAESYNG
ncbi:unnamed protein product [Rotaria sp. Silwood2]|nr:unnamed protein product [Rotaria sp. Silwood2]CAF2739438.1 unnamed protein product [Rotaria sp. Silwood2]CAF3154316.1 unnamed protein product [Rotaria sp. Silwood2]CAF4294688.1 unnamed protein product [Rotaria sp. Silwood2]CAF4508800.1 unnamed protein product [Rotaria sp. Silwood2]